MSAIELKWLDPTDPNYSFPSPESALDDPEGLLAAGGDLSSERILKAYRCGIFPWYQQPQPILWWCPNPRGVLYPKQSIAHKSVLRTLRRQQWRVTFDTDFENVIQACAEPRTYSRNTWITDEMKQAYGELHEQGYAHSLEVWNQQGKLVGGIYGLAMGKIFAGESMFSRANDASKIALLSLAAYLDTWGYTMIDTQLPSKHLSSLGGQSISRKLYLQQLEHSIQQQVSTQAWQLGESVSLFEWLASRLYQNLR